MSIRDQGAVGGRARQALKYYRMPWHRSSLTPPPAWPTLRAHEKCQTGSSGRRRRRAGRRRPHTSRPGLHRLVRPASAAGPRRSAQAGRARGDGRPASGSVLRARVPSGEGTFRELQGADHQTRRRDHRRLLESRAVRRATRCGARVTGFPSVVATMSWVAEQFTAAGLSNVLVQQYDGTAPFWWAKTLGGPASSPTRALARAAATSCSRARCPVSGSQIPGGTLSAPLVYVGLTTDAALPERRRQGEDRGAAPQACVRRLLRADPHGRARARARQARRRRRPERGRADRQHARPRFRQLRRALLQPGRRGRQVHRGGDSEGGAPRARRAALRASAAARDRDDDRAEGAERDGHRPGPIRRGRREHHRQRPRWTDGSMPPATTRTASRCSWRWRGTS